MILYPIAIGSKSSSRTDPERAPLSCSTEPVDVCRSAVEGSYGHISRTLVRMENRIFH